MFQALLNILSSGAVASLVVWLASTWFSQKINKSVTAVYDAKLETHKSELTRKIESFRHENQLSQLRTSLFFDHQRIAFASLLSKIAEINDTWLRAYVPDEGLLAPVPSKQYKDFERLLREHSLFLDEDCLIVMSLIKSAYSRSLPYGDGSDNHIDRDDSSQHLATVEYLLPRAASIFRSKIGVESNPQHLIDVLALAGIELVNSYHFGEIETPPKGNLSIKGINSASDRVSRAIANIEDLKSVLQDFDHHLNQDGAWFHEPHLQCKQILNALNRVRFSATL